MRQAPKELSTLGWRSRMHYNTSWNAKSSRFRLQPQAICCSRGTIFSSRERVVTSHVTSRCLCPLAASPRPATPVCGAHPCSPCCSWDSQWTWVCANSRRCWRTGNPGVLQSTGSQRVRHDWATKHNITLAAAMTLKWPAWFLKPWGSRAPWGGVSKEQKAGL